MTFPLSRRATPALRHALPLLALATPLLHLPTASAQLALPNMGDGADITTSEERRLGDRIIRSLYRDPDYIDDLQLHAYVMDIWLPLVQASKDRGDMSQELQERFAWQVLLGRDKSINAFALPGGYLGVHLGLIGAVTSRDELASVMAHELTHVTQRHIARMIGEEKKSTPLLIAGMILGALAASKSPDGANAMIVGGQAAAIQNQLGFSRDMEREADRIGSSLLAPAGFAPQGAVSMFEKLQYASRLNDNGSWPYLRSHPLTTERIADMQARIPHGQQQAAKPTMEHAMMAARARAQPPGHGQAAPMEPPAPDAGVRPTVGHRPGRTAHAAALSQIQLKDWEAARQAWAQLGRHAQAQGDRAAQQRVRWLGAELELAAQQPQAALRALGDTNLRGDVPRPQLLLASRRCWPPGRPSPWRNACSLGGHTPARCRRLAPAVAGLAGAAPDAACHPCGSRAHAAHYDAAAVDRFKAGRMPHGAARAPPTTSRSRSSTRACVPWKPYCGNRRARSESMAMPSGE